MRAITVIVVCDNPELADKAYHVLERIAPNLLPDEPGVRRTTPQFYDLQVGSMLRIKFYSSERINAQTPVWDPSGFDATPLADPALILSLHCKKKFNSVLIKKYRCINLHPGLLPGQEGWAPYVHAIAAGDPAGCTLHEMTDEIDQGPLIARSEFQPLTGETGSEVYAEIQRRELEMLEKMFPSLVSGDYWTGELPEIELKGPYGDKESLRSLTHIHLWSHHDSWEDAVRRLAALTFDGVGEAKLKTADGRTLRVGVTIAEEVDDGTTADDGTGELEKTGEHAEDHRESAGSDSADEDLPVEQQSGDDLPGRRSRLGDQQQREQALPRPDVSV